MPKRRFASWILSIVVILAAALGGYYYFEQNKPCQNPIEYSLGTFDTRFSITKANFLSAISEAEKIWEAPINRELFKYSDSGALKINLVYDARQAATQKLSKIGLAIDSSKVSYEKLKASYESYSASYDQKKQQLELAKNNFDQRKAAYDTLVSYWNAKGGAPASQYQKLEQERLALNSQASEINAQVTDLNDLGSTINSLASNLNTLASQLNLNVNKYNGIAGSEGPEFEEGLYTSDSGGTRIDIYQFNNNAELVRVLAHELGHALGLDHVDDPNAIMYRLNQSKNDKLTGDDLNELKARCSIQ